MLSPCRLLPDRLQRELIGAIRTTFSTDRHAFAMQAASSTSGAAQGRRRLLKERYVAEEADYGRVSYGMRVATVDRLALVQGLISPK